MMWSLISGSHALDSQLNYILSPDIFDFLYLDGRAKGWDKKRMISWKGRSFYTAFHNISAVH